MFKKAILAASLLSNLFAADYIVPYDYDNIVASVKSHNYGAINQSSPLSTSVWNIGGSNVHYRCYSIPKISCSAATPVIFANLSEVVLTKPDAVVANQKAVFKLIEDLRSEDAGTSWNVCGAAIGGVTYDNATYSGGMNTNTPYQYSETYTYFTDTPITNSTSYMFFTYFQQCQ